MSRAEKQRRRQHRLQKKHRGFSSQRWGESDRLRLLSYDITFDKLDLRGETLELSDDERGALFDQVHHDPTNAIERIKLHLNRHPLRRSF